jgi:hypothetical protein
MRILLPIVILSLLGLIGCTVNPKVTLSVQQTTTNLDFDISTTHVNGLLGLRVWQADTKDLLWDVDLHHYPGPRITYGVVPRAFKTFAGLTSSAKQKFPTPKETPRSFAPSTQYRAAVLCQYDSTMSASVREFYFAFMTDADGRVFSVSPMESIPPEDFPKTQ